MLQRRYRLCRQRVQDQAQKDLPLRRQQRLRQNPRTLLKKFVKKLEHGALGVITQPVFDKETALSLLELFEEAKIKSGNRDGTLILGLFPVTRLKTAQFLASHVPGIHVPKLWIDALYDAQKKGEKEEERVGLELSRNIYEEVMDLHPKVHLMTANRFTLAQKLLGD